MLWNWQAEFGEDFFHIPPDFFTVICGVICRHCKGKKKRRKKAFATIAKWGANKKAVNSFTASELSRVNCS